MGQVGLLEVGLDPAAVADHDADRGQPLGHHLSGQQSVGLADHPRNGRAGLGLRKFVGRLALLHLAGEDRGIDPGSDRGRRQRCPRLGLRAFGIGEFAARRRECLGRRVHPRASGEAAPHQLRLARVVFLRIGQPGARRGDVRAFGRKVGLHSHNFDLRRRDRRVGLGHRDPVGLGIDSEQQVPGADRLILAHADLDDPPADFGADRNLVLLDIGVVGRDVVVVGPVIPHRPADQQQRHRGHDRPQPQAR